jgi:hypothetical protein
MADTQNLSDAFKIPGGNIDTTGKLPGQSGYNKDLQTKFEYKVDIPTTTGQTAGSNENNPVAVYRTGVQQPIGTITSQSGFTPNLSYLAGVSSQEEKLRKAEQRAIRDKTQEINKQVIQPTAQKKDIKQPIKNNEAATDPKKDPEGGKPPTDTKSGGAANNATKEQFATIAASAAKSYKGRKQYPKDLRYPEKMNENQDCIQFKIIEYTPSKLGLTESEDIKLRTTFGTRNALSTITLPMPSGGITDRNSVSWQDSELNSAQAGLADVAMNAILGGAGAGADSARKNLEAATAGNKDLLAAIIAAKLSEQAVGTNNLLSRAFGVQINQNLELLFDGPQLRDFSFSFKMTPRSRVEAEIVRSIIRTFKQAMSVKRSESTLLLKSPHTFRIKYLTSNKEHPYLNRFKECALTNCSVNYTPDGQYMSYDDSDPGGRSMTAYELSLSFNELEPIFDDDYENMEGAKDSFNHIGY